MKNADDNPLMFGRPMVVNGSGRQRWIDLGDPETRSMTLFLAALNERDAEDQALRESMGRQHIDSVIREIARMQEFRIALSASVHLGPYIYVTNPAH